MAKLVTQRDSVIPPLQRKEMCWCGLITFCPFSSGGETVVGGVRPVDPKQQKNELSKLLLLGFLVVCAEDKKDRKKYTQILR